QQLLRRNQDLKKSTLYVYHLDSKRLQKIGSDSLELRVDKNTNGPFILASNPNPYLIEAQWKAPNKADYYRVNLETGQAILIGKELAYTGDLSADGRYFSYYNATEYKWILLDIEKQKQLCMNCSRKDICWNEDLNGQPMEAGPVGFIGYAKDTKTVYFQSEYDIWGFEVASGILKSISNEQATKEKIELRFTPYQNDSAWTDLSDGYITGLRKSNKNELLYFYTEQEGLTLQFEMAQRIAGLQKAEQASTFLLRKMDVQTYPDLWLHDTNFNAGHQISVANPQQKNYNWASVELVTWKAYDGQILQGLLYKPANYNPAQEYPLLFYYYELNSDNLHNYQAPKPSASIINPTEYASGGYLVFVPDIRYEPGKPAKGAYNAIMSATDHLVKNYPIDAKRMGLQGQSWGGYQTAMLITMTNRFAAAMAGAPVSNMFSAYGGIRWGSGINRQFQYESTQSRIGATIWEKPELYIENSPLFHLPKVQTPLLIMANDQDGAVPWYQGLELYNGLRRLGKPCWMLNYNGDDHNLTKLANKYDLSIRMRQFFDHYLMNAPAPNWMTNGIQAVDKGKVTGY
ncbi:MAG: alpha/beta hydrolase family protein, partial [Flavobacteriales bacterium]